MKIFKDWEAPEYALLVLASVAGLTFTVVFSLLIINLYWFNTGHCCGFYIPYFDPMNVKDSCLPIQDTEKYRGKFFDKNTHCDLDTFKRLPN